MRMDEPASLKHSVLSAIGWATATRFLAQLANWAMTLATVRFLHPQDYGLAAVTMTVAGFASSLGSVGLIDAVVQNRRITEEDLRSVFGLVLAVNAGCLALLCALAYPAAWFYGEPRLAPLLQFASLMFIPLALQAVPRSLLDKRLDLKTVSRVDLVARISSGSLILLLAWGGVGVWSLVIGPLVAATLRAAGFGLATRCFQLPRFRFDRLSDIVRFGGLRTIEQVLWYLYSNCDIFIIGKLLGADVLGIYYVSRNLAALPVEKFALTVRPAAFPAFALVQHDRGEALRYLKKAMRLLAFASCPVFFGLAAVAPQAVAAALGPKWAQATQPLAILAIAMALRPVGLIIPPFLMGLGEFAASFRNTLFATILFPAAFLLGSHWGLIGVCTAWLVAYPIQLLVLIRRAAIVSQSSAFGLVRPLLSPLAGSLLMYIAVRWTDAVLPAAFGNWTAITWLVAIGVLVYLGYVAMFLRPVVFEFASLARR
jgi:teichuronic acid exporter